MFCSSCGKEINDQAVVCPYCGVQTGAVQNIPQQPNYGYQQINPNTYQQNQADETNVGIVILSVLFPIIGIILGAVNMSNGKKKSGKAYLLAGVITVAVEIIIGIFIGIAIANNPWTQLAWALR